MMILRKKNHEESQNNTRIKIGNDHIENVSMYHYLGVDLDRGLTFDKMLDNMFNIANRKLYMLKCIGPYITNIVSNHIYKTHVLPMLDYADFLVDSGRLEKIERLDTLQKRVVKVILVLGVLYNHRHRCLNSKTKIFLQVSIGAITKCIFLMSLPYTKTSVTGSNAEIIGSMHV